MIIMTKKKKNKKLWFFFSLIFLNIITSSSFNRIRKDLGYQHHTVFRIEWALVERASIIVSQGGRASSLLHWNSTSLASIGTTGCHLREFEFTYPSPNFVGLDSRQWRDLRRSSWFTSNRDGLSWVIVVLWSSAPISRERLPFPCQMLV